MKIRFPNNVLIAENDTANVKLFLVLYRCAKQQEISIFGSSKKY